MKDYYGILKVDRSATSEEIRNAYLKLAKEHHPDKVASERDPASTSEEFALIVEAYKVLMDRQKRRQYDLSLLAPSTARSPEAEAGRAQAESSFKHGVSALESGEFARAELYFRAAVDRNPEVAKYKSYLGVAIAGQGKRFKMAEARCKEAIQMEIYNSEHYVNLGIVYLDKGEEEKARVEFQHALEWNPHNQRATKELESLDSQKKGILDRLLKKRG